MARPNELPNPSIPEVDSTGFTTGIVAETVGSKEVL